MAQIGDLLDLINNGNEEVRKKGLEILCQFSGSDEFRAFSSDRQNCKSVVKCMMRRLEGQTSPLGAVILNQLLAADFPFLDEIIEESGLFGASIELFSTAMTEEDADRPLVPILMLLSNTARRSSGTTASAIPHTVLANSVLLLYRIFTTENLEARWVLAGMSLRNLFSKETVVKKINSSSLIRETIVQGATNRSLAFRENKMRTSIHLQIIYNFLLSLDGPVRLLCASLDGPELILSLCLPLYPSKADSRRPSLEDQTSRSGNLPPLKAHPFVEEWSWGSVESDVERLCIRSLDLLLGPEAENAEIFKDLGVYEVLRLRDICSEKDSSLQEESERIVFAILSLFPA